MCITPALGLLPASQRLVLPASQRLVLPMSSVTTTQKRINTLNMASDVDEHERKTRGPHL